MKTKIQLNRFAYLPNSLILAALVFCLSACGSGSNPDDASDPTGTTTPELGAANPEGSNGNEGSSQSSSATAINEAAVQRPIQPGTYTSDSSTGFVGTVLDDGNVEIVWTPTANATGYNVYRAGEYITSVSEPRYIDTALPDGNYYYEIVAYDAVPNFTTIAEGLTVKIVSEADSTASQSSDNSPEFGMTPSHILEDYELVFKDEFSGSELDTSKWNTSYLWGPDLVINQEEQYYVDIKNQPDFGFNPFTVDADTLTIESVRTPQTLLDKANSQRYLSGVITSYDSFQFTYGYVEARLKLPYGQGFWSAFWLLNAYYVNQKPEIDIMEHIGNDRDVVFHTYHYYDSNDRLHSTKSMETAGVDFTSDFHTFAVEWKPGTIIYYVDGKERHSISDPSVSSQSMYIIVNTALGGWWPGSPDERTPFPAPHKIDYIRAWQKRGVQDDQPFNDGIHTIPYADDVPGQPPNHRPTYEQWPDGWPERETSPRQ